MRYAAELVAEWRKRAEIMRRFGASAQAIVMEELAAELEHAARQWEDELLSPAQAEAESGYSERRLRELVAANQLRNYGKKGAPLYRRSELPTKARRNVIDIESAAARFLERAG